jgi:dsDNA-specific endonuclease/ATPase MutS2
MSFINESLLEIRNYTIHSINTMDIFLEKTKEYSSYSNFHKQIEEKREHLLSVYELLKPIYEFKHTISKFGETGYMLRCYYELYSNKDFESALSFSMGFNGYIDNMMGVYSHFTAGHVSFATFAKKPTKFNEQYYPPLIQENPVKNDCNLKKNIIISAPNKAGKTTVLKTTTINIIFTQQLGCGFYSSGTLKPYTHIHSYLNIPDTSGRDSLFQAESRRCKDIIDLILENNDAEKHSHFCIFDELYSGTNPDEACKAGCAFLEYLNGFSNVDFILTTHYMKICKKFKKSEKIQNYKMEVNILKDGNFEYTYKQQKGISQIKGAIRVLKDMEYPKEIIDIIEKNGPH